MAANEVKNAATLDRRVLRCFCGWGEDVFEIAPAQHEVRPEHPYRMTGSNPDRRMGDFTTIDDAKHFLTKVMGYTILEEE
jgi:hypothetical protein